MIGAGQRVNRRCREVGFIFIAAIRRDSTLGVGNPREEGEQPTSLGQSVAVVTVNDATSNAVGTPSVFISLSLSLFSISLFLSLFLFISALFRRFLLLLARHRRFVSFLPRFASALVPTIQDRLEILPGVRDTYICASRNIRRDCGVATWNNE